LAKFGVSEAELEEMIDVLKRYVDYLWIPHQRCGVGDAASTVQAYYARGGFIGSPLFAALAGGGGAAPLIQMMGDRRVAEMVPAAPNGYSGLYCTLMSIPFFSSYATLSSKPDVAAETWNVEVALARRAAGGAHGIDDGLILYRDRGVAPGLPSGNNAFMGIVGDGAGGWQICLRGADGAGIDVTQAIPDWPSATKLVRARISLTAADPLTSMLGQVRFFVDDVLKLEVSNGIGVPAMTGLYSGLGIWINSYGDVAQALRMADFHLWCSRGPGVAQR
jgi:hypothetical protein